MITLICGPMFSGKSTELIRQLERKHIAGKKTLYIRPNLDSRDFVARGYSGNLSEITDIIEVNDFNESHDSIVEWVNKYDSIFVDEYFMIPHCNLICKILPDEDHRCDIYFGGLLSTAENAIWPEAVNILPYCDDIVKLNAVCTHCGSEHANYSLFKGEKKQTLVIGDNTYTAVCRKCYGLLKGHL